jgi:hypothetical protein
MQWSFVPTMVLLGTPSRCLSVFSSFSPYAEPATSLFLPFNPYLTNDLIRFHVPPTPVPFPSTHAFAEISLFHYPSASEAPKELTNNAQVCQFFLLAFPLSALIHSLSYECPSTILSLSYSCPKTSEKGRSIHPFVPSK